jgi:hypothetical protein
MLSKLATLAVVVALLFSVESVWGERDLSGSVAGRELDRYFEST